MAHNWNAEINLYAPGGVLLILERLVVIRAIIEGVEKMAYSAIIVAHVASYWKLWSTAPPSTKDRSMNSKSVKFNMLQISVQCYDLDKLDRMTACTRTNINNVVL